MNRGKRLAINSISSLLFQMVTIICGFILPRLILSAYGSTVNGLVNSITQFIAVIGFLELGVGAVVQSSLYRPLAIKDYEETSKILRSAEKFFKRIALILLLYLIALVAIYPRVVKKDFDVIYTITLICAMGISSFAQYYFGIVDRLLLNADQRGYIQYNSQTITVILNTLACVILIRYKASIQLVKLTTSVIYIARPLFLRWYINTHYKIDRKIQYQGEPIKQKWNGVAQHIAAVVLDGTDTIVLTLFSDLSNVSIYSVYFMVVHGVKILFTSLTTGFQALLGELLAKEEIDQLVSIYNWMEWLIHTATVFLFGCTASLIVPFVLIYTNGINDVNYNVPVFALLLTLANAMHCLRLPYNTMILASGHFRQTQNNYIIATFINIVISVFTVRLWGLVGVAIGTLFAMIYQTVWMSHYVSKYFFNESMFSFTKHCFVDILSFVVAFLFCKSIHLQTLSYYSWIILGLKVSFVWISVLICVNYMFYRGYVMKLIKKVFSIIARR